MLAWRPRSLSSKLFVTSSQPIWAPCWIICSTGGSVTLCHDSSSMALERPRVFSGTLDGRLASVHLWKLLLKVGDFVQLLSGLLNGLLFDCSPPPASLKGLDDLRFLATFISVSKPRASCRSATSVALVHVCAANLSRTSKILCFLFCCRIWEVSLLCHPFLIQSLRSELLVARTCFHECRFR